MLTALLTPVQNVATATTVSTLAGLCLTGAMAARAGGASPTRGALRVMFWGALAMAAAAAVGRLLGAHVI